MTGICNLWVWFLVTALCLLLSGESLVLLFFQLLLIRGTGAVWHPLWQRKLEQKFLEQPVLSVDIPDRFSVRLLKCSISCRKFHAISRMPFWRSQANWWSGWSVGRKDVKAAVLCSRWILFLTINYKWHKYLSQAVVVKIEWDNALKALGV